MFNRAMDISSRAFFLLLIAIVCSSQLSCKENTISLNGEWMMCRSADGKLPGADAEWKPVVVPSFLSFEERPYVWYRRSVEVPKEYAGKHVFLRFGGVKFVSEVYVNGKKVGTHFGGWLPFEFDITQACRTGEENELMVRVMDVRGVMDQELDLTKRKPGGRLIEPVKDGILAPVGSRYSDLGIWQDVSVISREDIYIEDVFVRTSVRKKEIAVDALLKNIGKERRDVAVECKVRGGPGVGKKTTVVEPNSESTLTFTQKWDSPTLWCPEAPHLYYLETSVREEERLFDETETRFGFREFWTEGSYFVLNGKRIKFLATAGHPRGTLQDQMSKEGAKDFYARIREANCVAMRLHANIWPEGWYEAADEVGMLLIQESALFCYVRQYALTKEEFWRNYHTHLRDMIRRDKNHPSIVMYSLENEILHCGGDKVEGVEGHLIVAGRFVKKLDPTRPIMYDADCDPGGVADVVNLHYPLDFRLQTDWPNVAYWLEKGMVVRGYPHTFFAWDRKKPLYFGEFLAIQTFPTPDPYTILLGDDAYRNHQNAMARAKAMAWTMQIEGYRATGVSGMCPWTLRETGPFPSDDNPRYLAVKRCYQPNAAFIREYDSRFFSGEKVRRTVYLYNDTFRPGHLSFEWSLACGGKVACSGKKEFDAQPADMFTFPIDLPMPEATERTEARLTLRVKNDGRLAFEEEKTYWIFPRKPLDLSTADKIAFFGEQQSPVANLLRESGAQVLKVESLKQLPDARILIVDGNSLKGVARKEETFVVGEESDERAALRRFVEKGGSVIVLEQENYPEGLMPGSLTENDCTIAFPRADGHPALSGLHKHDLRMWRRDHFVSLRNITKPSHGAFVPVVDSGGGNGLVFAPLLEVHSGRGRYLLSQFLITTKLDSEPVARILLQNLLNYAAGPVPRRKKLAVLQEKLPLMERVEVTGAIAEDVSGSLSRVDLGKFGVLLAEADAQELGANLGKVKEFISSGGAVILHAVTPASLKRISGLAPKGITLQKTTSVPVFLDERDELTMGMSNQELYWVGSRKGLHYRVRTPLDTSIVDYVMAPTLPEGVAVDTLEAEDMEVGDGSPRFQEDCASMHTVGSVKTKVNFGTGGEYVIGVRGRGTPVGGVFPTIVVSIDGKTAGSVSLEGEEWDTYAILARVSAGTHTLALQFVNDAWDPGKGEDRNCWLDRVTYGQAGAKVGKYLLSPPALVKVPVGKGMVVFDQIRWDSAGESDKRMRYLSLLLTNLGVEFRSELAGLVITAANMQAPPELRVSRVSGDTRSLGSNGYIFANVRFASTRRYEFLVKARGTEAAGEFPKVQVSIGDTVIGETMLRSEAWQILHFTGTVEKGDHEVRIAFTNDYYNPPDEDRNLQVWSLEIR